VTLKIGVANSVARAFGVLRAVGFGDQLSANAKKVDNVGADRDLPTKLETAEATISQ
jgi:predicted DNA repair protein MutK